MFNRLSFLALLAVIKISLALNPALNGISVTRVGTSAEGKIVDVGDLWSSNSKKLIVFGTYAADFNAIEYLQRLKHYGPRLKRDASVEKIVLFLNASPAACSKLLDLVSLSTDDVEVYADPTGLAGKAFKVSRGWRPEDKDLSPYLKLWGMLFGLGAWATLPSVVGGYIGNPFTPSPWIEDALVVNTLAKRFPTSAVELDPESGALLANKFDELPVFGAWGRRPLELATLRLQNMIGISLQNWEELRPTQEGLDAGVLTQLGGLAIVDAGGIVNYEWRDEGICDVANFEIMLSKLARSKKN